MIFKDTISLIVTLLIRQMNGSKNLDKKEKERFWPKLEKKERISMLAENE